MNARPIRLLIVDDSAVVRRILSDSLADQPDIEVIGTAINPYEARDKILELKPDVLTLDIEMPLMDGLTFLKVIMQHRPMPVIIVSSLAAAGSHKALEALQAGAVDIMQKPDSARFHAEDTAVLAEKIRAAARSRFRRQLPSEQTLFTRRHPAPATDERKRHFDPRDIILIGASTGGTEAIRKVLTRLSTQIPPIVIVQHIPAYFSAAFAQRLNSLSQIEVREAQNGDRPKPGLALIAPGGHHLVLRWNGGHYDIILNDGPKLHHQRPAVDVLFESAAKCGAAPNALAMVLTGMGADGAAGLLSLKNAGAETLAQDEESCVVFGMPREAIRLGAAREVLPIERMAQRIEEFAGRRALTSSSAAV
ncbi:chemotaxis-specific protein-glutamate methyltransferase CheB [bacterium]|nr:chemotaxis-specific protein-glutamate methyltransferase CheB [bacterium]